MTSLQIEAFKTKLNVVTESLSFLRDLSQFQEIDPAEGDAIHSLMMIDKILDERIANIKRIINQID
jgi:hypothetical protein